VVENKGVVALDINGNPIKAGDVVRYLNTGTVGQVLDVMKDGEGTWAQMDTTGLYYQVDVLLIVDASELKDKKKAEKGIMDAEEYAESQSSSQPVDIGQVTGGG
jgi:hypothetical protein